MLVEDVMQHPVRTVTPDTSLLDVYRTMEEHAIRHLPILRDGRLIGVITDRDIRYATRPGQHDASHAQTAVEELMTEAPITAGPVDPVEEAARLMRTRKIGCLPVLDGDELVGIVTVTNLLDAVIRMTGLEKPSGRLAVSLDDKPGQLAQLTTRIAEAGLDIRSVLSYHEDEPSSDRAPSAQLRVILRLDTLNVRPVAQALREEGFDVTWPVPKPA
jgi:acetoin utilization protein AcuB